MRQSSFCQWLHLVRSEDLKGELIQVLCSHTEFASACLQECIGILLIVKMGSSCSAWPIGKGFTPLVYKSREILVQVVLSLLFIAFANRHTWSKWYGCYISVMMISTGHWLTRVACLVCIPTFQTPVNLDDLCMFNWSNMERSEFDAHGQVAGANDDIWIVGFSSQILWQPTF